MHLRPILLAVLLGLLAAGAASAAVITFDDVGLVHGEIVSTQIPGVTISAFNQRTEEEIAAVFNTELTGTTADDDLQRDPPNGRSGWAGGNLPSDTVFGNALIIPENTTDVNGDDILDFPDDEGERPAGSLIFIFDSPLAMLGFDLIDVEGAGPNDEPGDVFLRDASGMLLQSIAFSNFGLPFGDATANRVAPFDVPAGTRIVEFFLGGSGAVDNVVFSGPMRMPEPGTLALLGAGLVGLATLGTRRRRRRR